MGGRIPTEKVSDRTVTLRSAANTAGNNLDKAKTNETVTRPVPRYPATGPITPEIQAAIKAFNEAVAPTFVPPSTSDLAQYLRRQSAMEARVEASLGGPTVEVTTVPEGSNHHPSNSVVRRLDFNPPSENPPWASLVAPIKLAAKGASLKYVAPIELVAKGASLKYVAPIIKEGKDYRSTRSRRSYCFI